MKPSPRPRIALAILETLGADEAFIGDLLEEFEHRASRVWLWRQVLASVPLLLLGRAQSPRPHRMTSVNLGVTPRGSAVGGLGLLSMVLLITVVAPAAWVVVVAGVAGGALLGAGLIFFKRRRERRPSGSLRIDGRA